MVTEEKQPTQSEVMQKLLKAVVDADSYEISFWSERLQMKYHNDYNKISREIDALFARMEK